MFTTGHPSVKTKHLYIPFQWHTILIIFKVKLATLKSRRRARAPEKKELCHTQNSAGDAAVEAEKERTRERKRERKKVCLPAGVLNEIRRRIKGQSGAGI